MKKGNKYGTHRVIEPIGTLPQSANKISNDIKLYDNEILIDVDYLNIDSASFTQLKQVTEGDIEKIKELIISIVDEKGKMQNPVTGSGGMLIGKIEAMGEAIKDKIDLKVGDKIATLVSLSLTPLKIDEIITGCGQLDPGIAHAKIVVTFVKSDGTEYMVPVTAQNNGGFSFSYTPDIVGKWTVFVECSGPTYIMQSVERSFNVIERNQPDQPSPEDNQSTETQDSTIPLELVSLATVIVVLALIVVIAYYWTSKRRNRSSPVIISD